MKAFISVLTVIFAHFIFILFLGIRVEDFTSETVLFFMMVYTVPLLLLVSNSALAYRSTNRRKRWIWLITSIVPGCLFIVSAKYQPTSPGGFPIFPDYQIELGFFLPAIHCFLQIIWLLDWVATRKH
ncbi:hypothetical protein [Paenibacillus faecis]|uniref:hypothetical protein n=1 Tax=Paenibacillus faecis TaxID=862114 RepID=UPI001BD0261F|nr:hypothetical protein [Paenibacillus faecis]